MGFQWYALLWDLDAIVYVVKDIPELTVAMVEAPIYIVCRIEQVFLGQKFDTTKILGSYIFLSPYYDILTEFSRKVFFAKFYYSIIIDYNETWI